MANEIRINSSLNINKGNFQYQSYPQAFYDDMLVVAGPTPGSLLVSVSYTIVNLSQLTTPGWCWLMNLDIANSVYVGIYNNHFNVFMPMLELLPGKPQQIFLSSLLGKDLRPGTGTVPADSYIDSLALKADVAPCQVLVQAFNR